MANISFNPALMTGAQESFLVDTQGYIQGITLQDPVSRMHLESGKVASSVSQPVWGGMGIAINTADAAVDDNRTGSSIALASTTQINGFTVFDQAINMVQTPGNTVPTSVAGMSVAYYRFGSKARVPLPIASGTLSDFESVNAATTLYWDTANLCLTTTSSSTTVELPSSVSLFSINAANSKTVSYNSTSGAVSWLIGQPCAVIVL